MSVLEEVRLETSEISPLIGTTVHANKATLLSGEHAERLRALLVERGVLVFPEIGFDDAEQHAFTATMGTVNEAEGVYKVTMDQEENPLRDYLRGAFYWHFDGFSSPSPILASLLSARRLSAEGGETEFCNCYAAYEALPDADKAAIEDLRVIHSFEETTRYWCPEPNYAQIQQWQAMGQHDLPLVWEHDSGRRSLLLGCSAARVVGMDPVEGRALLTRLRDFATRPEFVYRHHWTVGDLVIWDNTGTMHRALPYAFDSGRMMHRTKLEGEETMS